MNSVPERVISLIRETDKWRGGNRRKEKWDRTRGAVIISHPEKHTAWEPPVRHLCGKADKTSPCKLPPFREKPLLRISGTVAICNRAQLEKHGD